MNWYPSSICRIGIAVIQRNVRKYLFLRNWSWWRLYTKVQENTHIKKKYPSLHFHNVLCYNQSNKVWFPVEPEFFQVLFHKPLRLFILLRRSCSLSYQILFGIKFETSLTKISCLKSNVVKSCFFAWLLLHTTLFQLPLSWSLCLFSAVLDFLLLLSAYFCYPRSNLYSTSLVLTRKWGKRQKR